jgi:hypothetical protein
MGRLPLNAKPITDSLDGIPLAAGAGTPIEGALRGLSTFCKNFQASNPMEKCVAVLVTDGAPSTCDLTTNGLSTIAANALTGGVTTFAVGLTGADFTLLDKIATAGGAVDCATDPGRFACDISSGPEQLVDVLKKIRDVVTTVTTHTETKTHVEKTPLACEWEIPSPPTGELFDRDLVNVVLTAAGKKIPLGQVASKDDCEVRGWHYDDEEKPTRIVACPETCDLITSASGAKIDILLGCLSIPLG